MLQGKNIIVTGSAGGIGKEMVRLFVEKGAHVWACCRTPREETVAFFEELNRIHPNAVEGVYFDLRKNEEIAAGMKTILRQNRPIHALVNNGATVSPNQLFLMTPLSTIRDVFEVNFFAQAAMTQYAVKGMIRHPDIPHSIVNISSIAALDGDPGQMEYVASKAAMIGMSRKLARELVPYKIRVNVVAPGVTETGMISSMSEEFKKNTLAASIGKKTGTPEEIAQIVAFLISDASVRINGQVIRADG